MRVTILFIPITVTSLLHLPLYAQEPDNSGHPARSILQMRVHTLALQSDSAYAAYKRGYGLILDEHWDQARRVFDLLITRYPKSKYVEDARYWSAFALTHTDRVKALDAYRKFIRSYPRGAYLDDAIADFTRLQVEEDAAPAEPDHPLPGPKVRADDIVIDLKALEHELRELEFRMQQKASQMSAHRFVVPAPPARPKRVEILVEAEKMRDRARLKKDSLLTVVEKLRKQAHLEAVQGIATDNRLPAGARLLVITDLVDGARPDDRPTFQILRNLATDGRQPKEIRAIAANSLSKFSTLNPVPVLAHVVIQDPDTETQQVALHAILEAEHGRSTETLINLFDEVPQQRVEQRQTILQAIAEADGSGGTDFLVKVARSSNNPDIRTAAVMYLSEGVGDKDRSVDALIQLFESTEPERKTDLRTILYGIANVGNGKAVRFLGKTALGSPDLRTEAVYYLSNIGGEEAHTLLHRVLEKE